MTFTEWPTNQNTTFGAMVDSLDEYMLKVWISVWIMGKTVPTAGATFPAITLNECSHEVSENSFLTKKHRVRERSF